MRFQRLGIVIAAIYIISVHVFAQGWEVRYQGARGKDIQSICFVNTSVGYAVGWYGVILKTTDAGYTWTQQSSGTTSALQSVFFRDTSLGYIVGSNGTILKTTNGGDFWAQIEPGYFNDLTSVYFTNDTVGYTAGYNGTIMKTTNGGAAWNIIHSNKGDYLTALNFTSASTGFACGWKGILLKTTNAGASWDSTVFTGAGRLFALSFPSPLLGFMVSDTGRIYKTANGGASWDTLPAFSSTALYATCFLTEQRGYAAGLGSKIRLTTDAGWSWNVQKLKDTTYHNFWAITFTSDTTGFLAGSDGYIYGTIDGGLASVKNQSVEAATFKLAQNYPNPFNPSTTIAYSLKKSGHVTLTVYDLLGRVVASLVDAEKPAGEYTMQFNASGLSSGIYIYRIFMNGETFSRKMMLIK